MTHGNLVATAAAVMTVIPNLGSNDVFLAYLPLAHVFELEAEVLSCMNFCFVGSMVITNAIVETLWSCRLS